MADSKTFREARQEVVHKGLMRVMMEIGCQLGDINGGGGERCARYSRMAVGGIARACR